VVTSWLSANRTRRSIVNRSVTVESDSHAAIWLDDRRDTQTPGEPLHVFSGHEVGLDVDLGEWDVARTHIIHRSRAIRTTGFCEDASQVGHV
jgi:hypothetical protein